MKRLKNTLEGVSNRDGRFWNGEFRNLREKRRNSAGEITSSLDCENIW